MEKQWQGESSEIHMHGFINKYIHSGEVAINSQWVY